MFSWKFKNSIKINLLMDWSFRGVHLFLWISIDKPVKNQIWAKPDHPLEVKWIYTPTPAHIQINTLGYKVFWGRFLHVINMYCLIRNFIKFDNLTFIFVLLYKNKSFIPMVSSSETISWDVYNKHVVLHYIKMSIKLRFHRFQDMVNSVASKKNIFIL